MDIIQCILAICPLNKFKVCLFADDMVVYTSLSNARQLQEDLHLGRKECTPYVDNTYLCVKLKSDLRQHSLVDCVSGTASSTLVFTKLDEDNYDPAINETQSKSV